MRTQISPWPARKVIDCCSVHETSVAEGNESKVRKAMRAMSKIFVDHPAAKGVGKNDEKSDRSVRNSD